MLAMQSIVNLESAKLLLPFIAAIFYLPLNTSILTKGRNQARYLADLMKKSPLYEKFVGTHSLEIPGSDTNFTLDVQDPGDHNLVGALQVSNSGGHPKITELNPSDAGQQINLTGLVDLSGPKKKIVGIGEGERVSALIIYTPKGQTPLFE